MSDTDAVAPVEPVVPTVLVVEDDTEIRGMVRMTLEAEGYRVAEAATCARALIEASTRRPDLVILDLGLPDRDGLHFIVEFRKWSVRPIVILSARTEEQEKVAALDAGADDYLTKPFGVAEMLARVRAGLRRSVRSPESAARIARFGDVQVDLEGRTVTRAGVDVHLTSVEFRLLVALITRQGKIVTHRQLLAEVWGPGHTADSQYLRVYMGHLRQKLEATPAHPKHLVTETGVGYRFCL